MAEDTNMEGFTSEGQIENSVATFSPLDGQDLLIIVMLMVVGVYYITLMSLFYPQQGLIMGSIEI